MRIVGAGFTRGEYLTGSGGQQLALRVSWGNRLGSANHGTGGCVRPWRVEVIVPFSHTLFPSGPYGRYYSQNRGLSLHADWRDLIPPKARQNWAKWE